MPSKRVYSRLVLVIAILLILSYPALIHLDIILPPNIILITELPEKTQTLPNFTIENPRELLITSTAAYQTAREIAGFQYITQGKGGIEHRTVKFGLYQVDFTHRLNHMTLTMPFTELQSAETLSDTECRRIADETVKKIVEWFPETKVKVAYTRVSAVPSTDGLVHLKRVHYQLRYNNTLILGNHTEFYIDVCEDGVWGFQINYPIIQPANTTLQHHQTPTQAIQTIAPPYKITTITKIEPYYNTNLKHPTKTTTGYQITYTQNHQTHTTNTPT